MRNLLVSLTAVLFCGQSFGQAKLSTEGQRFEFELNKLLNNSGDRLLEMPNSFQTYYDLYAKRGHYYVGCLALVDEKLNESSLFDLDIQVSAKMGDVWSLRVPVDRFRAFRNTPGIQYIEVGSSIAPDLDRSRYSTRTDSVHLGTGGLKSAYTGKGIIVAVIDWGFDYTHPTFYDTSGENLRISRAWDQNRIQGPAPGGFDFGHEYIGQDELLAAGSDTAYVFGNTSHGTHTSGITAGSGYTTKYTGIAPDAEIIMISLKRDDAGFVDAITYVSRYADAVGKPFVVNMSFGNHSGPHDGSTLRNRALDVLAGKSKIFIASAGNNGDNEFHILQDFDQEPTFSTTLNFATFLPRYWGETVNAWGEAGKPFTVSLDLLNANDSVIFSTAEYSTDDRVNTYDTLYADAGDTLILRMITDSENLLNKKPNLLFEVRKLGNNRVVMRSQGSGKVHFWHIAQLDNRVTNWGQDFVAARPGEKAGDDRYGIGGPPAVSKEVTTVASHRGEVVLPNGHINLGQLSYYSSIGPTADGRVKPEISGPGQDVASSVSSFDPESGNPELTVNFKGKDYDFVRYSGTSMSGPAVAGIVALMLEANPNLTAKQVKSILKQTARLDQHTGQIGSEGSTDWGWGKANALEAVKLAELMLNIRSTPGLELTVYPNPANERVYIDGLEAQAEFVLFDMQGRKLKSGQLTLDQASIGLSEMAPGSYILQIESQGKVARIKLVH